MFTHRIVTAAVTILTTCLLFLLLPACASKTSSTEEPQAVPPPASLPPPDPVALERFTDIIAADLAADLPDHQLVRSSSHRQVLGVAPLRTSGFSDPAYFGTTMASLRGKLANQPRLTDAFRIVTITTDDAADLLKSLAGDAKAYRNPDGSSDAAINAADYHPADVFALSGTFLQRRSLEPDHITYLFEARVTHPQTRQLVLSREFRYSLKWDSIDAIWREAP